MAASCWTGGLVDYEDSPSPSPSPSPSSTSHSGGPPASPEPGASASPTARSCGPPASPEPGASASPTARSCGPPTPGPGASTSRTPRSRGPPPGGSTSPPCSAGLALAGSSAPGAATSRSPSSAAAGQLLASASTSSRLRRRRWGPPLSTFPEDASCAVVSITADPDITISDISGLHDWIQCAHNRAPFVLILTYASRHALTEEVDVPGSVPVLKRSKATPDVLILLRRWYNIFWCMHRAGYGLRGRFGPGNFVVYESSNNPQMDLRMTGSLHIVKFNSLCGHLDYAQFVKSAETFFAHGQGGGAVVPPHLRAWLDWIARGYIGDEYLIRFNSGLMDPREAFSTTMALYRLLEEMEMSDVTAYNTVMQCCRKYDKWDYHRRLDNQLMDSSRRFTIAGDRRSRRSSRRPRRRGPFDRNVRGVLKLGRDCSEHPAKGLLGLMLFIMEQDFSGFVAEFHDACFRAGLLQKLHLEATMA